VPVLTRKQYQAEKVFAPSPASPVLSAETSPVAVPKGTVADSRLEYVIMYPEIPSNGARPSFKGTMDGKSYYCENGIIRTKDKLLSDALVSQGHVLLEIKETENEIH